MNLPKTSGDVIEAPDFRRAQRSGRAVADERGNSVWEWETQTGVFTREVSPQKLDQLLDTDLQVVEYAPTRNFGLWVHDSDREMI